MKKILTTLAAISKPTQTFLELLKNIQPGDEIKLVQGAIPNPNLAGKHIVVAKENETIFLLRGDYPQNVSPAKIKRVSLLPEQYYWKPIKIGVDGYVEEKGDLKIHSITRYGVTTYIYPNMFTYYLKHWITALVIVGGVLSLIFWLMQL